jgi:hypothetical protein
MEHADHREQDPSEVQYLELREFALLLISRRPLVRVWGRHQGTSPGPRAVVRDESTGQVYAAKLPAGSALGQGLLDYLP